MLTVRRAENYYSILGERKSISSNAGRITKIRGSLLGEREREMCLVCVSRVAQREKLKLASAKRFSSDTLYFVFLYCASRFVLLFSSTPLFPVSFFFPFFLSHNWRMHGENCRTIWLEEETLEKMSSAEEALIGESTALLLLPCVLRDYTMHRATRLAHSIHHIRRYKSSAACADQIYYLLLSSITTKSQDDDSRILSAASSPEMAVMQTAIL